MAITRNGVSLLIFVSSIVATAIYARENLGYLGLWWDETAQFWISQGINHYAEPGTESGGLIEAFRLNRFQNMDPGGFTFFSYYWTRLSQDIEWVRTLPFLFFLLLQLSLGVLGWKLSRSGIIAAIAFALPLLYSGAMYFGMENRAYSMEMAGVAVAVTGLMVALEKQTPRSYLLLGVLCAIFLTSRYSFVLIIAAIGLAIMYTKPKGWSRSILPLVGRLFIFAIPVMLTGGVVFWLMLRYQVWPEMTDSSYLGIAAPVYSRNSVLEGNPQFRTLVNRNLFSPAALPITLSIIYFLFIQNSVHKFFQKRYPGIQISQHVSVIFVFVIAIEFLTIFLSFLGMYPWDIGARWNAYLLTVSMIACIGLLTEIRMLWHACAAASEAVGRWEYKVGSVLGIAAVLGMGGYAVKNGTEYRLSDRSPWPDLADQIHQYHDTGTSTGKLFVTRYDIPVIRYLYEYGPFRQLDEYPALFRFETDAEWRSQLPIDADYENVTHIVSGIPVEGLQERFPKNTLIQLEHGRKPLVEVRRSQPGQL